MKIVDVTCYDDVRILDVERAVTVAAKDMLEFYDAVRHLGRCQVRVPDRMGFSNCGKLAVVQGTDGGFCTEHGSLRLLKAAQFTAKIVKLIKK